MWLDDEETRKNRVSVQHFQDPLEQNLVFSITLSKFAAAIETDTARVLLPRGFFFREERSRRVFCFEVKRSQDEMFCSRKRRTGSDRLVLFVSSEEHSMRKVEANSLQLQISSGSLIGVNNTPDSSPHSFLPVCSSFFAWLIFFSPPPQNPNLSSEPPTFPPHCTRDIS